MAIRLLATLICFCLLGPGNAQAQENCCACSPKISDSQCFTDCYAMRLPRCPTTALLPNPALNQAHGWIGVAVGRNARAGALIVKVAPDSPPARAGLRPSDEIIGFDGNSILNREYLISLVRQEPAGRRVRIDILRAGKRLQGELIIGEQDVSGR